MMTGTYKDSTSKISFLPKIHFIDENSSIDKSERHFGDDMSSLQFNQSPPMANLYSLNDVHQQVTYSRKRYASMPETRMKPILESPAIKEKEQATSQKTLVVPTSCPCAQRPLQLSVNQRQRRCVCTCKPGSHWNNSTKLPKINITKTGILSYNRDFCYRVINPRAVIEEAIFKRRGYCATRNISSNKNKKVLNKLASPKKVSGEKYVIYDEEDKLKVVCDASKEFKATVDNRNDVET